jgi:membrane protease YdiL (CAAX protease family)
MPLVFLEEVGWRYYLFNAWKDTGFLLAGPILGLIWAVWHLPTFFFYGSFWFNLSCYLLFVPAIHFLAA